MKIFHGCFENELDVVSAFEIAETELNGIKFIYAAYDIEYYEGEAFVIFVKDGNIYEVNGSHCSCNGLEDQWVPEETLPLALLSRPGVCNDAKNNIKEFYKNLIVFM